MNTRRSNREEAERIEAGARALRSRTLHRLLAGLAAPLVRIARPREHYLARAGDHADLESRMRYWDREQQRAAALCTGN